MPDLNAPDSADRLLADLLREHGVVAEPDPHSASPDQFFVYCPGCEPTVRHVFRDGDEPHRCEFVERGRKLGIL